MEVRAPPARLARCSFVLGPVCLPLTQSVLQQFKPTVGSASCTQCNSLATSPAGSVTMLACQVRSAFHCCQPSPHLSRIRIRCSAMLVPRALPPALARSALPAGSRPAPDPQPAPSARKTPPRPRQERPLFRSAFACLDTKARPGLPALLATATSGSPTSGPARAPPARCTPSLSEAGRRASAGQVGPFAFLGWS